MPQDAGLAVESAQSIMELYKEDDLQRPARLFTNLLLQLWIGASLARASSTLECTGNGCSG